ncbi:uncharacterized protein SPPG_02329 [Spizellomyces punctatus DAOM BR117]|uniref:DNA-directed RNA polymerase III subunit RPC4 n=1 Tax=Spizellomyces punctatus (strain DAOM BR117) TaxID=645134 RepID=A0A0L0HQE1_SPIPD|nr:uncharacterized protein SPPG_02329 [Spizellomyces punctatus DAOM BR117]KND03278.1 hypothetical protein SPPG_02329 [Spizellomyces punctatus DAOM BR117]|eukprot:XP_016611317.1 hypothetical protein SPPG_02329 [Spizellomyces punctatus DAOM BR117]
MTGRRRPATRSSKTPSSTADNGAPESSDVSPTSEADTQRQPGTLEIVLPSTTTGRLGSLRAPRELSVPIAGGANPTPRPKFAPTVPARRKKADPTPEQPQRDERSHRQPGSDTRKPRGQSRRQELTLTASGPFAFGPAQRGVIATPGRASAAEANLNKVEYAHQRSERKDEAEDDGSFDPDDVWAPVTMGGPKHVKMERLKRERQRVRDARRRPSVSVKIEEGTDNQMIPPPAPVDVDVSADIDVDAMDVEEKPKMGPPAEFVQPEENQMLFFQFPSILPKFDALGVEVVEAQVSTDSRPVHVKADPKIKTDPDAAQKSVGPDGRVGKLVLYRSGKMKLKMGNIMFDVTPGPETSFLQNVVAVDAEKPACYILGDVSKRFVCSPDIESLLLDRVP